MHERDMAAFSELLGGVHAFYRRDFSKFSMGVWWSAMLPYDLAAVSDALTRHCMNPDTGQFMPMPADVTKMLGGSTQDAALVAWAKVDRAVRQVGGYASVVFDDAMIHRVLSDMGGWVKITSGSEKEWPFVQKEFVNRYRGIRLQGVALEYPPVLIGTAEAQNNCTGMPTQAPMLLGDPERAQLVMARGQDKPLLARTQASGLKRLSVAAPEVVRQQQRPAA